MSETCIISLENKMNNLCESCKFCFADCRVDHLEFGIGMGLDNVVECDTYDSDKFINGIKVIRK